jgi:hypothetical protein
MLDELFLKIIQLSAEEKLKLLEALENHLAYEGEGFRMSEVSITTENEAELMKRAAEISEGKMCLIEFDDHIYNLQTLANG